MTAHAGYHYTTGRAAATFAPDRTAACRQPGADVTVFFAPEGERHSAAKERREAAAKAICDRCPLRPDCAAHAVADPSLEGIWGGLTDSERRARRRANAILSCPSRSARKRHAAKGETCRQCGVGFEPLPDLERAEAA